MDNPLLLTPLELAGTFVTVLRERIDQIDFEQVMAGTSQPQDHANCAQVMAEAFQRLHSRCPVAPEGLMPGSALAQQAQRDAALCFNAMRAVRLYLALVPTGACSTNPYF